MPGGSSAGAVAVGVHGAEAPSNAGVGARGAAGTGGIATAVALSEIDRVRRTVPSRSALFRIS